MIVLLAGLLLLLLAAIPYLYYLCGMKFGKKDSEPPAPGEYPLLSIIISAYNEEAKIGRRIEDIAASTYPSEIYEVIFVNDCSDDRTGAVAEEHLRKHGIPHQVLTNASRMGTNRSYNMAMEHASHEIIITTDANKFTAPEALSLVVSRLVSDPSIGAVCADVRPSPATSEEKTGGIEGSYRNYYGQMCEWESAIDSTYNFNGPLVAFRRSVIGQIEERRGADDANTAFAAIRAGYRAVYEPRAVVYEDVPADLSRQYRQKIRRATRLLEATLSNLDLLKADRPFSQRFFPVRLWMYLASPLLFFTGGILLLAGIFIWNSLAGLLALAAAVLIVASGRTIFAAFVLNQAYLIAGMTRLGKDMRVWESTT